MEDHLVAAYSALLIGHMIMNQADSKSFIQIDSIKTKLKDGSFKYMTQIIRKFIIFMKIMVSKKYTYLINSCLLALGTIKISNLNIRPIK